MSLTQEEVHELAKALSTDDAATINRLMNLYQQRSPSPLIKQLPHIYIAVADTSIKLFEYFIRTQHIDNDTLFNCLDFAMLFKRTEFIESFFSSPYVKFDPNYVLPNEKSVIKKIYADKFLAGANMFFTSTILSNALYYANLKNDNENVLQLILNLAKQGKININQTANSTIGSSGVHISNETVLLHAIFRNYKPHLIKQLLESGADPYLKADVKLDVKGVIKGEFSFKWNVFEFLQYAKEKALISHTAEYVQILNEWKEKKGKQKGHEDSSTHSSSSNSPMSLTPNGSPPQPSVMVRHSPPDSPEGSRKVSPPGSPMHRSDSSSSGSAGSSPEKMSLVRVTPKEKAQELLRAANNDVDVALFNAIKEKDEENDLAVQKILVDTGNLKFREVGDSSVLFAAVIHGQLELLKYIFSKYPTLDVHKTVNYNQQKLKKTLLHGAAISTHDNSLHIISFLLDRKAEVNARDARNTTPLHNITVSHNAHKKVEELILRGANPLLTNDQGNIPSIAIGLKCSCEGENPDAILLEQTIENATEQARLKQRAGHIDASQSIIISAPAEIQYRPGSAKPAVTEEKASYGSSSSTLFQNTSKPSTPAVSVSPVVFNSSSSTPSGATMFVPLPQSSAQLHKQGQKVVQRDAADKNSNSILSTFKKLISK